MILYHFTDYPALNDILREGAIKPFRWNEAGRRLWPKVVWLTAEGDRESVYNGWDGDPRHVVSRAIRFTVDLPDAAVLHWRDWAHRNDPSLPGQDSDEGRRYKPRWYVTEQAIPYSSVTGWEWAVDADAMVAALESLAAAEAGR